MIKREKVWRTIAALLILSVLFSFLTGCRKNERTANETEDITFGIDVARYQGTIDWQQVKQSEIDFAIVRVGYRSMADGEIHEDPNGRYNLQEGAKAGVPLGAYFFSTAVSEEEAMEEAAWVAELISGYPITYPVVYDCEGFLDEDSRQNAMSKKDRTDAALAFLETIEKLGYEGMFYASKGDMEFEKEWDVSRIEEEYKIWVAQYPVKPYPETAESSYGGVHHMWQYSTNGSIPGISQPVDLNIAYFGYNGIEQPKSKKAPAQVSADPEAMMDFEEVNEQVTAKNEINLRDIPSQDTDSQVLETLMNGEVAQRIAISRNGWSKLIYKGNVYYAVSSYLTTDLVYGYDTDITIEAEANSDDIQTQFSAVNQQVTAKDLVNLRKLPSVEHEDADVIAQLKNGDIATCVGVSDNGWSKLVYRGTTCYAVSSYLMPAEDVDEETAEVGTKFTARNEVVTAKEKVNLRRMPSTEHEDADIITQLLRGDQATRIGISDNGWSKLIYNGTTCYAASRYLEIVEKSADNKTVQTKFEEINDRVTPKDEVNLRTLPSVEDPDCVVVARIHKGDIVTRTGINRDLGWSRVIYNGQTLYCVSSYLTVAE